MVKKDAECVMYISNGMMLNALAVTLFYILNLGIPEQRQSII